MEVSLGMDNLGKFTGSRAVELYNGRAEISLFLGSHPSVISLTAAGLAEAFFLVE
jgi:hypothetical protein